MSAAISEVFSIFVASLRRLHTDDESVLAFILVRKSGKFQRVKDGNRTHRLFGHVFANTYWQVWGIVYLTRGLPEPPNG